jgi:hypothetical protein
MTIRARLIGPLLAVSLSWALVQPINGLAATAPLTGETLTWNAVASFNGNDFCLPPPNSTATPTGFHYSLFQPDVAAGPYQGTFAEDGDVSFNSSGVITSWDARFTIYPTGSFTPVVYGETHLAQGGGGPGACTRVGLGTGNGSATLTYTAKDWSTGSVIDSGTSTVVLAFSMTLDEVVTGTFTEVFGVVSAAQQLSDLLAQVTDQHLGPGSSFVDKLTDAQNALAAGDITSACDILNAFIHEVTAQSGKKLTPDQAKDLIRQATSIRNAIPC